MSDARDLGVGDPDVREPRFGPGRTSLLSTARLIPLRTHRIVGKLVHRLLRVLSGVELPSSVPIGPDLVIHHHADGLVVHPRAEIGSRVHLFHRVTIGVGGAVWEPRSDEELGPIIIEDDVWLCAGAAVIAGDGELRVGRGTIVGAHSVLFESTGPWEIWAGAPARRVGRRRPSIWVPPRARDSTTPDGVIWLPADSGQGLRV